MAIKKQLLLDINELRVITDVDKNQKTESVARMKVSSGGQVSLFVGDGPNEVVAYLETLKKMCLHHRLRIRAIEASSIAVTENRSGNLNGSLSLVIGGKAVIFPLKGINLSHALLQITSSLIAFLAKKIIVKTPH